MQDNRPSARRLSAATIIGTLGSGLLVTTVVRLFQVAQEILPWWWPYPLIIGSILFVLALLLLMPSRWWQWANIRNAKLRLRNAYLWTRYGPKCIIGDPVIEKVEVASAWASAPPEPQYTAKFTISVKNKAMPIKLRLHEAIVFIEQETEWGRNSVYLGNIPGQPEIEMEPFAEGHCDLVVGTSSRGGVILNPPDLQKEYKWGIQRIYVTLPRSDTRELHKGIYRKKVR